MRLRALAALTAAAASLTVVAAPAQAVVAPDRGAASSVVLDKEAVGILTHRGATKAVATTSQITYRKGPVMTAATGNKVYIVWYGAWAPAAQTIVTDLVSSLGGSPRWGVNATYYDTAKKYVSKTLTLAGQTVDLVDRGLALSDTAIRSAVTDAIAANRLPADKDGVYLVLTAAGVTATSGFLTQYCGWHTYTTVSTTPIKYGFIGDPTGASLGNCAMQTTSSPNGNAGVDAMASVIVHELDEAVSDPQLNAWYDARGYENADKCAWTFGTTYAATGGGIANVKLGARDFLVQRNWSAKTQTCTMS